MAGAHDPHQGFGEQALEAEAAAGRLVAHQGRVAAPRVEGLEGFGAIGHHLQDRAWRPFAQKTHHLRDQDSATVRTGGYGEAALGGGRVEARRGQGRLHLQQGRVQGRADLQRPGRRLHAGGAAREQLVVEQQPQPPQGMADRRLAEAQPVAGPGDVALVQQGVEHPQEIQVDLTEMNSAHGGRDNISFGSWCNATYMGVRRSPSCVLGAGPPTPIDKRHQA